MTTHAYDAIVIGAMAVLQMAMLGWLPYTTLRKGLFAHPTLAESFNNLFLTLQP